MGHFFHAVAVDHDGTLIDGGPPPGREILDARAAPVRPVERRHGAPRASAIPASPTGSG